MMNKKTESGNPDVKMMKRKWEGRKHGDIVHVQCSSFFFFSKAIF